MSKKPRYSFRMKGIAPEDWRIYAGQPGPEPIEIPGFKTKAEVDEWLSGSRKIDWLRAQGLAKQARAGAPRRPRALREHLHSVAGPINCVAPRSIRARYPVAFFKTRPVSSRMN